MKLLVIILIHYSTKIGIHFAYTIQKSLIFVVKSVTKRFYQHGERFKESVNRG